MDFNDVVLAQLQRIVESQSELLESQCRLAQIIEGFEGRFQTRRGTSSCLPEGDLIATSNQNGDSWPVNIAPRYFSEDADNAARTPGFKFTGTLLQFKDLESSRVTKFVALPDSSLQLLLDFLLAMFAFWDITTTSFFSSWGIEYEGVFWAGVIISPPFWTLDFLRHFIMAFYEKGELQTGKLAIAASYAKTYLCIDLLLVTFDWAFLALSTTRHSEGQWMTPLRALQCIKLFRIIQMMRILSRLLERWNLYTERKFSERTRLIISSLVTPTLCILWTLHFLACLFYLVGAAGLGYNGRSWFDELYDPYSGTAFVHSSLVNQYLTAYHFSIAAVSCAGNFERPVTNASERGVMIFELVVGFVFGGVFISLISAIIVDYQIKQNAKSCRLRQLRRYLCENNVELATYQRTVKQAERCLLASERLKEEDVDALTFLSKQLFIDIRLEVQWPPLQRHPLFRLYQLLDEDVPRRLCRDALCYLDLSVGDELFKVRDLAECAYILTIGSLLYVQSPQTSHVAALTETQVNVGKWLSEAALFSKWLHVGLAHARLSSRLLTINASALATVVLFRDPHVHAVAIEYGCEFHRRIKLSLPPNEWPDDLVVPCTDYCEIVLSLSSQCQVEIGKCAIGTLSHAKSRALMDEVFTSKAVIILTENCEVYRIKSIVTLRVEDAEGKMLLAQLGTVTGRVMSPSIMLPSCTIEKGELISDCLERVLKTKFSFLHGKIDLVHTLSDVIESESKEFSIKTRYYRNVVKCKCLHDPNFNLQVVGATRYSQMSHKMSHKKTFSRSTMTASIRGGFEPPTSLHGLVHWNDTENGTMYAWLSEVEFDHLRSGVGADWLQTWYSECEFVHTSFLDV